MRHRWILLFLAAASLASAQPAYVREHFDKREVEIPMRDGVKLFTSIYIPKGVTDAPFLMQRTPYSCRPYGPDAFRGSLGPESEFTKKPYIFVYQDVRGRYMSEGEFAWMRPFKPLKKPGEADETTDTWDTIDWLLENVKPNNGRVGVYGTSFPGHYAAQCLIHPHPALKAAAPQAPMADNWLGDDMHHNGAFWLPHAMNFIAGFGKKRDGPTQDYGPRVFQHGTNDGYKFFLEMGPLKNANAKYLHNQIAIWNEWMEHGDYDAYWQAQNVPQHLRNAGGVAIMTVGGWFDAEDLQGPLRIYRAIERFTPQNQSTLVMGPWYHGSWNGGPGNSLHDIVFTVRTGEDYRTKLQMPFFEKHLRGVGEADIPEAMMFDTGADRWSRFDQWPPASAKPVSLYLRSGKRLSFAGESRGSRPVFDEYVSDPAHPVPVSATVSTGMPREYMLEDQRFVGSRKDVLTYSTPPLIEDVTLLGPVTASLYVSTTGTDSDFIVKLIDVLPDDAPNDSPRGPNVKMGGYQMMVRGEPMRAKYRNSWSHPEPMVPGKPTKLEFAMPDVFHTFLKGHKIMVQVQSSWFPVVDRNPQTFVNIYTADAGDFHKATQRVYLSGETQSAIRAMRLR
ncbi:MAG: CocE/NonD family hydrolase [Fimbriimonadaceae bacterium]|nr:CocE/NonD family hydrolase [Fimbriimonadaceae bacterium]